MQRLVADHAFVAQADNHAAFGGEQFVPQPPVPHGDAIVLRPLRVVAMHTPGHTPGSTCWHAGDGLFAGDTVFVNACGRCDLAGGDPEQMFQSLKRVSELPGGVRLFPGHDYGDVPISSVARERERNPYFQKLASLTDFVAYRMRPRE